MNPYLASIPQWLVVLLVPRADGKTDKIPVNPASGQPCDAHDRANWTTYEHAAGTAAAWGPQFLAGFVLTAADDLFCLDIDGALQADGTWSPLAQALVQRLPGCMVEVSQSGRGLHVWGRYPSPPAHRCKRVDLGIELYTERRFIAIGTHQTGDMLPVCDALPALIAEVFPPIEAVHADLPDDGPSEDWRGPTDDDELLRRALQSRSARSAFGAGPCFADLWEANDDVLARAYPGTGDSPFDRSSADMALAQHLAFWTGRDQARIAALMRRSALARDKWEREDYLPRTIATACRQQREVLQDKPAPTSPLVGAALSAPADAAPVAVVAQTALMTTRAEQPFLTAEAQAQLFAGCIYVIDQHRVLCPGGRLMKPEQFRVVYGGYTFAMDGRNERTSRNAFEAFTESQVLRAPVADGTCFRPDLPYGTIIETEGRRRANVYWPANVRRVAGDPSPFLNHLAKIIPNERDRTMLLYYLAGCVQFAGEKFQWFPLIVGVEGNGKSALSRCVAYACGQRYSHWPSADKLGKEFNAWLFGKTFYAIEDLKIGDSDAVWEKLKPMITGENLEIEGKGVDQRTEEVCGNFLANSNHKNAVRATLNDRRVMHVWCAQMTKAELLRDGLDDAYMARLYDWLRYEDGYAIVAEYLHTLPIPEQYGRRWLKGRAPTTAHTADAIAAGLGPVEQEIQDAIERDEMGFRGGWISSGFLDGLLKRLQKDRAISLNRRREVLQALGYDWHPALTQGRVNNAVVPDGAKVKLFVRMDRSDLLALARPAEVAAAYSAAQMGQAALPAPAPR